MLYEVITLVHEVTMGVYFDDQQGWRPETPMTQNTGSVFAPQTAHGARNRQLDRIPKTSVHQRNNFV